MRDAVRIASGHTGSVITSAGLILAGTFGSMATASLMILFQVGVAVAIGVLIDTFLVRSILVPAITTLAGDWAWWPSGRRSRTATTPQEAPAGVGAGVAVAAAAATAGCSRRPCPDSGARRAVGRPALPATARHRNRPRGPHPGAGRRPARLVVRQRVGQPGLGAGGRRQPRRGQQRAGGRRVRPARGARQRYHGGAHDRRRGRLHLGHRGRGGRRIRPRQRRLRRRAHDPRRLLADGRRNPHRPDRHGAQGRAPRLDRRRFRLCAGHRRPRRDQQRSARPPART